MNSATYYLQLFLSSNKPLMHMLLRLEQFRPLFLPRLSQGLNSLRLLRLGLLPSLGSSQSGSFSSCLTTTVVMVCGGVFALEACITYVSYIWEAVPCCASPLSICDLRRN